jgi:hypothetical protein
MRLPAAGEQAAAARASSAVAVDACVDGPVPRCTPTPPAGGRPSHRRHVLGNQDSRCIRSAIWKASPHVRRCRSRPAGRGHHHHELQRRTVFRPRPNSSAIADTRSARQPTNHSRTTCHQAIYPRNAESSTRRTRSLARERPAAAGGVPTPPDGRQPRTVTNPGVSSRLGRWAAVKTTGCGQPGGALWHRNRAAAPKSRSCTGSTP